ncbi:phosphoenolpyruvate carboxylase [Alkalihalobacillus pseudalcaliphilus]|uniref:phosphoenolpyruvate carboxylase n=1 Tax=Alkalihalobacillus pseudalcaliphilus TaxID=79884 RepID=UPI00064D7366|nr:phosphoenolpyruvate carboxylase [Alkalihalobacillus pseudalcaliphilus]KMK75609.1 phosphoenolpyruvate carboxylase [Alkalihalobacillus pseudalcaliphilus]
MTAMTDNNVSLRNDVKKLGNILGEILQHHGGTELFNKVETIREMTKKLRQNYDPNTYEKLKAEISNLKPPTRQQVIRAFSVYFHLVNMAEQNHRIRRRKQYQLQEGAKLQSFSLEKSVSTLKDLEMTSDEIKKVLNNLSIELIITAHPTEATKRTVLEIQKRISYILNQLDSPLVTKKERIRLEDSLYNEVATLWQTDELRHRKPTVIDEVKNGLYYFEETLFETIPEIHQELEQYLQEYYPEEKLEVPNFLHFGSWIGGDRDGNPNVTPEVTWETLQLQRQLVLKKYRKSITDLMKRFSQSSSRVVVNQEFVSHVEQEESKYLESGEEWSVKSEIYRRKFAIILKRLSEVGKSDLGYQQSEELEADLIRIRELVEEHQPSEKKLKTIRHIIRQVQLFGFHLVTLDIRNHSGEHEIAVSELLNAVKLCDDYSSLTEEEKIKVLTSVLKDPRPISLLEADYSEETLKVLNVFKMIRKAHLEFGTRSIEVYLVSMTQSSSDLLEVLVLAKEAGIYRLHADGRVESGLHVAPLLETIDDLVAGPQIMRTLFDLDLYRYHLQVRGDHQEIMLGYSDGSKDGGTLTANWKLFNAQLEIHQMAKNYDIRLKFFHGRGGSLGRGGGPLNRSIVSQPVETLGDGVKITEQGEVLSSRYLLESIAFRNLEQATSALVEATATVNKKSKHGHFREKEWELAMEEMSQHALRKYQSLVFEDNDFLTYFNQATPLKELGELNIGSRPTRRKNSSKFEDLRAIPWVFAWTQSRQMIPAWYGAGTGFSSFLEQGAENLEMLQNMYQSWPFFHSTIHNLQMALMKADLFTAKEYLNLVEDSNMAERIYSDIATEYQKTKEALLKITGNQELLDNFSNIQESVRRRNPYVDPLNFLQVDLIQKMRTTDEVDEELMTEVLLTISGVAAGLVNTG